jgi:hypothetical protein
MKLSAVGISFNVSYRKVIRDLPLEVLKIEFDVAHVLLQVTTGDDGLLTLDEPFLVVQAI